MQWQSSRCEDGADHVTGERVCCVEIRRVERVTGSGSSTMSTRRPLDCVTVYTPHHAVLVSV